MKAVVISSDAVSNKPTLEYKTVPDVAPEAHELLIKVAAIGVNRIDLQRSTAHGAPKGGRPLVAGLEMAGEVISVGSEVSGFSVGDRVMGMTPGAYAELATIDHRFAMKIPEAFSFDQAAAVSTVYPTAYNALVTNAQFSAGKTVLIQAIGSAVGIAALQIAKAMGARCVIGAGTSERFVSQLQELGLDKFVRSDLDDVPAAVSQATDGKGVDVIIDMVGGTVLEQNLQSVALGGRIVNVGWVGATKGELDLDTLAKKRATLIGVSFRTCTAEEKATLYAQYREGVYPFYENGAIQPVIQGVYPLADAEKIQDMMAGNNHFGKFILKP